MQVRTIEDIRKAVETMRFTRGTGMGGPEYFGCCGTGMRPLILRCPYKQITEVFFMVGPELVVEQLKFRIASERLKGLRRFKYFEDDSKPNENRAVFIFKTKTNAIAKFLELCQAIMTWNQQQADEARKAREQLRANPTDMKAALTLGDMGLL